MHAATHCPLASHLADMQSVGVPVISKGLALRATPCVTRGRSATPSPTPWATPPGVDPMPRLSMALQIFAGKHSGAGCRSANALGKVIQGKPHARVRGWVADLSPTETPAPTGLREHSEWLQVRRSPWRFLDPAGGRWPGLGASFCKPPGPVTSGEPLLDHAGPTARFSGAGTSGKCYDRVAFGRPDRSSRDRG